MQVIQSSSRSARGVAEAAQTSAASATTETVQARNATSRASTTHGAHQHPSAYSRLYAQAVDLREHKDFVFQQFGLHKTRNKAAHSGCASPLSASKVASMNTTRPPAHANAALTTLQRTTTSRNLRTECVELGCAHVLSEIDHGKPPIGLSAAQSSSFSLRLLEKSRDRVATKYPHQHDATFKCTASTVKRTDFVCHHQRADADGNVSSSKRQQIAGEWLAWCQLSLRLGARTPEAFQTKCKDDNDTEPSFNLE
uniref:Uncharacterized protein n=1 Tax=Globisporangium ultimum (strain ATCC 200006 / CBS 805.95 / DAOM BR144) TaxID=431595 RepID=K3WIK9_GLOUD